VAQAIVTDASSENVREVAANEVVVDMVAVGIFEDAYSTAALEARILCDVVMMNEYFVISGVVCGKSVAYSYSAAEVTEVADHAVVAYLEFSRKGAYEYTAAPGGAGSDDETVDASCRVALAEFALLCDDGYAGAFFGFKVWVLIAQQIDISGGDEFTDPGSP
jgi:hypothetical protein